MFLVLFLFVGALPFLEINSYLSKKKKKKKKRGKERRRGGRGRREEEEGGTKIKGMELLTVGMDHMDFVRNSRKDYEFQT